MKKYFATATVALSMLSMLVTPAAYAFDFTLPDPPVVPSLNVFTDVSVDSPYYNALVNLKTGGVISGYPDGSFQPDKKINRAEFTKIIVNGAIELWFKEECMNAYTFLDGKSINMFKDVITVDASWYLNVLCYAKKHNLVGGYPDGSFKPGQNVNFAEAAKISFNAFQGADAFVPPLNPNAPWYFTYASDLAFRHAIPMTITHFNQELTRGEMAEIMFRLRSKNTGLSSKTYEELK